MTASRITDPRNLDNELKELQTQLRAATLLVGHLGQVQQGFDGLEKRANALDGHSRKQLAEHVKVAAEQQEQFLSATQSHDEGLERLEASATRLEEFTTGAHETHETRWSETTLKVAKLLETVEKAAELTKADLTVRHHDFKNAYDTELKTLQNERITMEKRLKNTQTTTTLSIVLGSASVAVAVASLVLK